MVIAVAFWVTLIVALRPKVRDLSIAHFDQHGAGLVYLGIGKTVSSKSLYVWMVIVLGAGALGLTLLLLFAAAGGLENTGS